MRFKKILVLSLLIFILNACATYEPQFKNEFKTTSFSKEKTIVHSFYLIGDAGNSPIGSQSDALKSLKNEIKKASRESTVVFLGDNVYPRGVPKKSDKNRAFAIHQLKTQTDVVSEFKGNTVFIPGNHDWYSGLKGLKRQEEFIEKALGKDTFLPENGCPIKKVNVSEDIVMIVIDSHWFITNWDRHPKINDDCDIKTRTQFFDEFEGLIKKSRGKTTVIAMHHPMFTNGPHGGQFSVKQHMKPVPILGTLKNIIRETSGGANVDITNKRYGTLRKRLITLSQENDKVIFVSGHEHSLQYIVQDNLPQIVSGSGSKETATRATGGTEFSYGSQGYAKLDVFKDGSSYVTFYATKEDKIIFETEVLSANKKETIPLYSKNYPERIDASIYTEKETKKNINHRILWGNRYRKDYSVKVNVPTVNLDTLFGGLIPVRKGGGHQSNSLRLENDEGQEFVMRALKKNAIKYIQAIVFKDQYIEGQFNDTYAEGLLNDVFTGSHPYAPFTIGTMAKALGVFHTNPVLYYVPKQNALGVYNNDFGDELYMIEERAASGHGENPSFGFANKVISTRDMLEKLRENQKHEIDEKAYIRARLFDMVIGDWDRHEDQWRWAVFKENNKTIYRPIPRDRDQAFSIMGDGALLNIGTSLVPGLRLLKSYEGDLKKPKWFNFNPYPLDMALINEADKAVWDKEVNHITTNLTDEVIIKAFSFFPPEIDQYTIKIIKEKLISRLGNLQKISNKYYNYINKFTLVKGTDKKDSFLIERQSNGKTKIIGYNSKKGEKEGVFFKKTYSKNTTKEIWVYGLDGEDSFKVIGTGSNLISIRIIGGQNKDTYNIENGKKITLYDYETKKNKFIGSKGKKRLSNDYEANVYNYKKLKNSANQLIPTIGFNPDDGLKLGIVNTYTLYGFERNPYTQQHKFQTAYSLGTRGFDFSYDGKLVNVFGDWNLGLEIGFTSPNFSINFFGFGNGSQNLNFEDKDNFGLQYNRVRQSKIIIAPSLNWNGDMGAQVSGKVSYESVKIQNTNNRFIESFFATNPANLKNNFAGIEGRYFYENKDNKAFPTLGMQTNLVGGLKTNVSYFDIFAYLIPSIEFDYKLIPNGQLVLATKSSAHINFGNGFEFYQAASIGGNNGLRGYRNQRFTGKNAFVQTTDLRLNLRRIKTRILPLNIGVYAGADYGRVWIKVEDSEQWKNNYGGGFFFNAANLVVGNVSVFKGEERLRVAFKLGFEF